MFTHLLSLDLSLAFSFLLSCCARTSWLVLVSFSRVDLCSAVEQFPSNCQMKLCSTLIFLLSILACNVYGYVYECISQRDGGKILFATSKELRLFSSLSNTKHVQKPVKRFIR
jgi:hypothetical protein